MSRINPWDWLGAGLAGLVILIAAVIALACWLAARLRPDRAARLADLTRDDVDPDWERTRQTLGPDPRK